MNLPTTLDGAVALNDLGLIRAEGADAASFLHGQLTQDMLHLGASELRLAGFCSAKGRLQASFLAWRDGDTIVLACSASVMAATLKRLSMFVLRAKCRLVDAGSALQAFGLVGTSASVRLAGAPVGSRHDTDDGTLIRLPDADGLVRALLVRPRDAEPLDAPLLDGAAWQALSVRSGVPVIEAATVDQFVPQMLNYELIGGVDFRKGCYPGQEVVARSQYRGTIKRRMFLFDVDAEAAAGHEVYHDADPGQPAGRVVNAARVPGTSTFTALVEVKLAALDGGHLHLGSVQGPSLRRAPLPYEVPFEANAAA